MKNSKKDIICELLALNFVLASGSGAKRPAKAEEKKKNSQKKDGDESEAAHGAELFSWDLRQEFLENGKVDAGAAKEDKKEPEHEKEKNIAEKSGPLEKEHSINEDNDTVIDESQDGNKSNEENGAMEKDNGGKNEAKKSERQGGSKELKDGTVVEKKNGKISGELKRKRTKAEKQTMNAAAAKTKMTAAKSKARSKATTETTESSKGKSPIAQKPQGRNAKGNNAKNVKQKKDRKGRKGGAMTQAEVKKSLHAARNLVTKPSSNVC